MKKIKVVYFILSFITFSFLPTASFAQKDSSLIKRISKSFCDEFAKKDKAKLTSTNMEMELGLLIIPVISKYAEEIEKEWGIAISDDDGMKKIGEKIGSDAALNCPAFQEFIMNNLDSFNSDDEKDKEKTLNGNFIAVETTGVFSSILIKNKSGKEEKMWWFEYFDGADEVVKNPAKLKSKAVTVKYKEKEIYDSSLKEYRIIKVITGLTIVQ